MVDENTVQIGIRTNLGNYRHVRLVVDEICFPYISETIGLFDIFSLPTVKTIYGVFPIEGYL